MNETLVSTKYQIVIPKKIRLKTKIKPGQKMQVYLAGNHIVLSPKKAWPDDYFKDLKGLWKNIDVKAFLDEERDSWER